MLIPIANFGFINDDSYIASNFFLLVHRVHLKKWICLHIQIQKDDVSKNFETYYKYVMFQAIVSSFQITAENIDILFTENKNSCH